MQFDIVKIENSESKFCCGKVLYISLMDVAQNLIFITSYYIYFNLLIILFSI